MRQRGSEEQGNEEFEFDAVSRPLYNHYRWSADASPPLEAGLRLHSITEC
jgi:hypothetical protein